MTKLMLWRLKVRRLDLDNCTKSQAWSWQHNAVELFASVGISLKTHGTIKTEGSTSNLRAEHGRHHLLSDWTKNGILWIYTINISLKYMELVRRTQSQWRSSSCVRRDVVQPWAAGPGCTWLVLTRHWWCQLSSEQEPSPWPSLYAPLSCRGLTQTAPSQNLKVAEVLQNQPTGILNHHKAKCFRENLNWDIG